MRHVGNGAKNVVLGLVALVATTGFARNAAAATCGDLNGNGSVNSADVTKLRRVIAGLDPAGAACGGMGALQCGDIRADGALAPNDVVVLLNYLAGNPLVVPVCTGTGPQVPRGTTIQGNISQTQTWTAGGEVCCPNENGPADIIIDGTVFVNPGVTLTINPGTLIKGKKVSHDTSPSVLVFLKGSKINAPGRSDCPIVMTSDQAVGSRNSGDWGGLVINGQAKTNCSGTGPGGCFAEGLDNVPFGGTDDLDSSGVMHYVRVAFSGIEISPDNELNVITLNGVGSGSTFDHLATQNGGDDCMEWFGGSVSEKFLVSAGCADDMFDTQLGTRGSFQYCFGADYQSNLQTGNGNNGFEWDDNENNNVALPLNAPKFCNVTMIGTKNEPSATGGSGALLRRGTNGKIANTIMSKFVSSGIQFNDNATMDQACQIIAGTPTLVADPLTVRNSVLFDNGPGGNTNLSGTSFSAPRCTSAQWYNLMTGNDPATAGGTGANPFPVSSASIAYPTSVSDVDTQFKPSSAGTAADCAALYNGIPFTNFDTTTYVGAFAPAGNTWLDNTSCWINFAKH